MRAFNRIVTPEAAVLASSQPNPPTHQRIAHSRILNPKSRGHIRCSVRASAPAEHAASGAAAAGASATSLIPQTLEEMEADVESAATRDLLKRRGQAALTREERRQRQRSLDAIDAPSFSSVLKVSIQPISIQPISRPYVQVDPWNLHYAFSICSSAAFTLRNTTWTAHIPLHMFPSQCFSYRLSISRPQEQTLRRHHIRRWTPDTHHRTRSLLVFGDALQARESNTTTCTYNLPNYFG